MHMYLGCYYYSTISIVYCYSQTQTGIIAGIIVSGIIGVLCAIGTITGISICCHKHYKNRGSYYPREEEEKEKKSGKTVTGENQLKEAENMKENEDKETQK